MSTKGWGGVFCFKCQKRLLLEAIQEGRAEALSKSQVICNYSLNMTICLLISVNDWLKNVRVLS